MRGASSLRMVMDMIVIWISIKLCTVSVFLSFLLRDEVIVWLFFALAKRSPPSRCWFSFRLVLYFERVGGTSAVAADRFHKAVRRCLLCAWMDGWKWTPLLCFRRKFVQIWRKVEFIQISFYITRGKKFESKGVLSKLEFLFTLDERQINIFSSIWRNCSSMQFYWLV